MNDDENFPHAKHEIQNEFSSVYVEIWNFTSLKNEFFSSPAGDENKRCLVYTYAIDALLCKDLPSFVVRFCMINETRV